MNSSRFALTAMLALTLLALTVGCVSWDPIFRGSARLLSQLGMG